MFTSGEAGHAAALPFWNGMIEGHPALLVQPTGVSDVMRAVAFAREHGLELSIKGGDFLNFVARDDADREERIRAGYGPHGDRLVAVKRRYDPDNVFHRNNTITP